MVINFQRPGGIGPLEHLFYHGRVIVTWNNNGVAKTEELREVFYVDTDNFITRNYDLKPICDELELHVPHNYNVKFDEAGHMKVVMVSPKVIHPKLRAHPQVRVPEEGPCYREIHFTQAVLYTEAGKPYPFSQPANV